MWCDQKMEMVSSRQFYFAQNILHTNEYLPRHMGVRNWSGIQLTSDPTTTPGYRTDDNDDEESLKINKGIYAYIGIINICRIS